jgi:hypothetical protein
MADELRQVDLMALVVGEVERQLVNLFCRQRRASLHRLAARRRGLERRERTE